MLSNGTFSQFTEFLIVSCETWRTQQKKKSQNVISHNEIDRDMKFFLLPEEQMISSITVIVNTEQ